MMSQVTSVPQIDRFTRTVHGFLDNMYPLMTCDSHIISQYGNDCHNKAVVADLESELELCATCFYLLKRGKL